ncbi:capsule assembly Wzi family protein [Flocculibacter collagenilyticus]|uniref:capsule assembly Wzi family protein n=1 Tax=Flocculibacter collagenilyticus TaxID=2744479 RepID=UPI0018F76F1C|nr:capsule assembly Wzi family protein [Flocculibacter collagenilyticus]
MLALFTAPSMAAGVSPYLPLKMAPEFEHLVERLLAKTDKADVMVKPYKAVDILRLLPQVQTSDPVLYQQINGYLKRFKKKAGKTHSKVQLSLTSREKTLANQRGQNTENWLQIEGQAFYEVNPYLRFSGGGILNDENAIPTNTMMSFGYHYAQVDIGYREHWYSPFNNGAMLISSHAEPTPTITISNYEPFTDFRVRYEMFLSKMDEQAAIKLGEQSTPGKPYLAGMHLSFALTDNFTIGLNRLMQFGGGLRSVGAKDVWQAFFDPVNKDNAQSGTDDFDDPNYEFGDQMASITAKYNFSIFDFPVSIYGEYGGEDSAHHKNYRLGNLTQSVGIFLPDVGDDHSLRFEVNDWHDQWYVHHLYSEGNSVDGHVIGHWGGDERVFGKADGATVYQLDWNWRYSSEKTLATQFKRITNDTQFVADYVPGYEIKTRYSQFINNSFWGAELYMGRTVFDKNFVRISAFYNW